MKKSTKARAFAELLKLQETIDGMVAYYQDLNDDNHWEDFESECLVLSESLISTQRNFADDFVEAN